MLSVTFQTPIVIDEQKLNALLALAGVPAVVGPYLNGHAVETVKRGRKPKVAAPSAEPSPASKATVSADGAAPKKRGRKSNAEKAALAAASGEVGTTSDAPAQPAKRRGRPPKAGVTNAETTPVVVVKAKPAEGSDGEALLKRFSALIDKDFDEAKGVLEQFGVARFSDLPEGGYDAFGAKLTECGV